MTEYLSAFYEGATEIAPDEIIGALAIGLVLAMACSGLCLLGRKRSSNVFPVFCGLIFAVSTISMIVGLGHARFKYMGPEKRTDSTGPLHNGRPFGPWPGMPREGWPGPPPGGPPMRPIGRTLLREADADKDGRLTPEEAAQYIRQADATGQGSVNADDLDHYRRRRDAPPSVIENPPEPGPQGRIPELPRIPDSPK